MQYTSPSGISTSHVTQSAASGAYTDTLTPNEIGPWTIRASWNGAQSPACPVVIYGKPVGDTLVIGDDNAVVETAIEFWGAQWWKDNTWSGGVNPGDASFKGFADAVDLTGALWRLLVHAPGQQLQAAEQHPRVHDRHRVEHGLQEWDRPSPEMWSGW